MQRLMAKTTQRMKVEFLSLCPSESGGQTKDGVSVLGRRGNRLRDDLQRLRLQLYARLRGHSHDEVQHPPPPRVSDLCCSIWQNLPIKTGAGRAVTPAWQIRRAPPVFCWPRIYASTVSALRPGTSTMTWTRRRRGTGCTLTSSRWKSTAPAYGGWAHDWPLTSAHTFQTSLNGMFLLQDLTMETELEAINGRKVRAIEVFAHALRFFRVHALKVTAPSVPTRPSLHIEAFTFISSLGGEGPVIHHPGGGGNQMGNHRPGRVAAACQTIHERSCVPGRFMRLYSHSCLRRRKFPFML